MRSCFLRAVLLSAAVVGFILVPALPAQAQCTHLGQQVVCPSGVATGSTSLFFTNGDIIWQTPTGPTTSSPRAGCCAPFTTPTPTATGLTPTTGAGQNALSNAVRTPSGAVVPDRLPHETEHQYRLRLAISLGLSLDTRDEAERQYRIDDVNRWWRERAEAAELEAIVAEEHVQGWEHYINRARDEFKADLRGRVPAKLLAVMDKLLWAVAYYEYRAREAEDRGFVEEARGWRRKAEDARKGLQAIESDLRDDNVAHGEQALALAQEQARAARERANAARRDAEETYRRYSEARREAEDEAERQRTEQAQPAQPVQQAQQFTVYFSDSAAGRSEYLRGYLEARPVINQSDAANARPPAPRSP